MIQTVSARLFLTKLQKLMLCIKLRVQLFYYVICEVEKRVMRTQKALLKRKQKNFEKFFLFLVFSTKTR